VPRKNPVLSLPMVMVFETVPSVARRSTEANMPEQILFSKRQAAQTLSISLRTLDKLIVLKRLPVHRIGRRVLISRSAIERFAIGGEK
jgi:excisionase family DNA binding protein